MLGCRCQCGPWVFSHLRPIDGWWCIPFKWDSHVMHQTFLPSICPPYPKTSKAEDLIRHHLFLQCLFTKRADVRQNYCLWLLCCTNVPARG